MSNVYVLKPTLAVIFGEGAKVDIMIMRVLVTGCCSSPLGKQLPCLTTQYECFSINK